VGSLLQLVGCVESSPLQSIFDLDTSFQACYPPSVVSSSFNHHTTEGYHNERLEKHPRISISTLRQEAEQDSSSQVQRKEIETRQACGRLQVIGRPFSAHCRTQKGMRRVLSTASQRVFISVSVFLPTSIEHHESNQEEQSSPQPPTGSQRIAKNQQSNTHYSTQYAKQLHRHDAQANVEGLARATVRTG